MKLALIVPKAELVSNNSSYASYWDSLLEVQARKRLWRCPTNGLLTVATLAEPYFDEIQYLDENYEPLDFNVKYDLVGISLVTHQAYRSYEIAREFHNRNTPVIMGGIHPTMMPEEAAQHADSVFIGEAEPVWEEFINDFKNKQLKKFYHCQDPSSYDLRQSPMPRYDLVNMDFYKMISISISKGCPHDCEFCASSKLYGYLYRHKTVEQVLGEVAATAAIRQNNTIIYFPDDNLIAKREFAKELFTRLIDYNTRERAGIRWYGHSDISLGNDPELLKILYRSGCRQLLIGFESLTKEGLKHLDKNNWKLRQLANYKEYAAQIQSHGIGIIGSFLIGLDGDDIHEFERIRDFVADTKLYATNITVQTPFPNTRLYHRLKNEKRLFDEDWNNYTGFEITYTPMTMTVEELQQSYVWLYKEINSEEIIQNRLIHFKEINRKLLSGINY